MTLLNKRTLTLVIQSFFGDPDKKCPDCGTQMENNNSGAWCPKCGYSIRFDW